MISYHFQADISDVFQSSHQSVTETVPELPRVLTANIPHQGEQRLQSAGACPAGRHGIVKGAPQVGNPNKSTQVRHLRFRNIRAYNFAHIVAEPSFCDFTIFTIYQ